MPNLAAQMTAPFFPLEFDAAPAAKEFSQFTWHTPFTIGPFKITPFPLHHPQDCTGFRVECGGKVIVYATDHEHGDAEKDAVLLQYAKGADILIADAQYTLEEYAQRKGFGHSTWHGGGEAGGMRRRWGGWCSSITIRGMATMRCGRSCWRRARSFRRQRRRGSEQR